MNTKEVNEILEYILKNEGYRPYIYMDSEGIPTGGYGTNIREHPLTEQELVWLTQDLYAHRDGALKSFWRAKASDYLFRGVWPHLSSIVSDHPPNVRMVLLDMGYNLGPAKLKQFDRMLEALEKHDYKEAAVEILDSKYAEQTKTRALRNARVLSGKSDNELLNRLHRRNPDRSAILRPYAQRTPGS